VLEEKLRGARQASRPAVDLNITFGAYAQRWLSIIAAGIKPRTVESYTDNLRLHLLPALGSAKVRDISKGWIKALLAEKLNAKLARNSVRLIHATLRAALNAAVDDDLIPANPARNLGRQLRLVAPVSVRQEQIKAMTRGQLDVFLDTTLRVTPGHYPLFLLMARTGVRIGEAIALQWPDINLDDREIRVERGFSARQIETPKTGHGRTVDMSQQLARVLRRLQVDRKSETLRRGWPEVPPWVFCNAAGKPLDSSRVRRNFRRVLRPAGLPGHFHPHCLRHTFSSLLLQQGVSPAYVQRQLGHASIKLTVDTYGKWLPMGNKGAVDGLDSASGSKMVAESAAGAGGARQTPEKLGEPSGTRTRDPLIKSQVLYQLS